MKRSTVAVLRTAPETVVGDVGRVMRLAGIDNALDPSATTMLKNNLSAPSGTMNVWDSPAKYEPPSPSTP